MRLSTLRICWATLAVVVTACGGSSPATPIGSAINGTWNGNVGTSTFSIDIHSVGETGIILGSGAATTPAVSRAINVEGTYIAPDVSLHFVATNYSVFIDGKLSGTTISGTIQGSAAGFNGQAITLTRR